MAKAKNKYKILTLKDGGVMVQHRKLPEPEVEALQLTPAALLPQTGLQEILPQLLLLPPRKSPGLGPALWSPCLIAPQNPRSWS